MGGAGDAALELRAARIERERSQAALDATREKLEHEQATVVASLKRTRQHMIEHNHVVEDITRQLRRRYTI